MFAPRIARLYSGGNSAKRNMATDVSSAINQAGGT
jgi:hypothetical protein